MTTIRHILLTLGFVVVSFTPSWAGEPPPAGGDSAAPEKSTGDSAGEPAADAPADDGDPAPDPAAAPDPPPEKPKAPAVPSGPPAGVSKAESIAWDAGKLVDEGSLQAAEAKANLAISVDSKSGAGRYQLARIRVRQGRTIDAYQALKESVAKDPTHAPSHMLLMRVSLLGGQSPAAEVQALDRIVANNPDNLLLKMALAEGYLATKQSRQAIQTARQVLKKAETSVGAMKLLARAYLASKRLAAAEAILRRTRDIRLDPEASFVMAQIRMIQKRPTAARDLLEEAVKLAPNYVEALSNLGLVYIKVRNYSAAEDVLTKAISLAPAFAQAFLNLGAAQRGASSFEAAEKSWRKALKLNAQMAEAHYNLGILYLENKLPGRDRIKKLQSAIAEFKTYKQSSVAAAADRQVDKYLGEAQLLIKQERERRKEELKSADEEKAAAAQRAAEEKKEADEAKKKADEAKKKADEAKKKVDEEAKKKADEAAKKKAEEEAKKAPDEGTSPTPDEGTSPTPDEKKDKDGPTPGGATPDKSPSPPDGGAQS